MVLQLGPVISEAPANDSRCSTTKCCSNQKTKVLLTTQEAANATVQLTEQWVVTMESAIQLGYERSWPNADGEQNTGAPFAICVFTLTELVSHQIGSRCSFYFTRPSSHFPFPPLIFMASSAQTFVLHAPVTFIAQVLSWDSEFYKIQGMGYLRLYFSLVQDASKLAKISEDDSRHSATTVRTEMSHTHNVQCSRLFA